MVAAFANGRGWVKLEQLMKGRSFPDSLRQS